MPHVPLHPGKEFAGKSKRGIYGDVVEEIDWGVGEILKALKKMKLDKNTIVWFMSDNGPWVLKGDQGGSAGLFRDGKGSTWEGGMRVPCFVYWPGHIAPGINEDIVAGMDVYATCICLAGGEVPSDRPVDGFDLRPYLRGESGPQVKNDTPFFYYGLDDNQLMAVRKGPWKLHLKTYSQLGLQYFDKKEMLLFDIYNDPSEKYEVSAEHPDIVKELLSIYEEQLAKISREGNFYQ